MSARLATPCWKFLSRVTLSLAAIGVVWLSLPLAHGQTPPDPQAPAPRESRIPAAPADPLIADLPNNPDLLQLFDLNWINAVPHVAVYSDANRKLTPSHILSMYARGERPRSSLSDMLATKTRDAPIWIVLPLVNRSGTEHWVLDFGTRLRGRTSYYNGIFLYEHSSRSTLINALEEQSSIGMLLPDSSELPLVLPLRRPILLVMLLQPDGLSPNIMPFNIRPDLSEDAAQKVFWQNASTHLTLMALIAGFFLAAALLSQRWGLAAIAVYLSSLTLVSLFSPETMFLPPGSYLSLIPMVSPAIQNLALILTVWAILRGSGANMANPFLLLAGVMIQIASLILILFYPVLLASSPWISFLTLAPTPIITMMICIHQARQGDLSGLHLAAVSLIQLTATMITFGAEDQLGIPPNEVTLNAVLLSLLFQALFFAAAMRAMPLQIGGGYQGRQQSRRGSEEDARLAKLRQVKEGFDYNNLLKVIEHERRQLSEARDREGQRTEEMRRAKEAADEANRAKSAFLAVISHEIRTPMTGVMGMVKMLQDTTLTKDQTEYVSTIKESGNAMMSLLNDILDFEKIESGKLQIESIDFDLHRLINGVATLMNGHATTKGIKLEVSVDSTVPRYMVGDVSRLRQVLLNLVGNAIKFTKQGSVTIRLSSTLQTGNSTKNHQVYFAVQDTGIGISREAQKNIFNPFAQADATISRKFGGTGLGLAISKRLVEAMGSQINISSRENEGTTFFFTLNLREGNAEQVEEQANTPEVKPVRAINHLRVLVVEDNEITQRVIRALLEQHGHQAQSVESGEDGLKVLQDGATFDLILSDIQMNGMTGFEFARQVRLLSARAQANTPIVALTGNVDLSDIQKCYEAGMNDHLAKPIDPDRFNDILYAVETKNFRNTVITEHPIEVQPTLEQAYETLRGGSTASPAEPIAYRTDNGGFDSFAHALDHAPQVGDIVDPETPAFQTDMLETLKESLGVEQLNEMLDGLFKKAEEIITTLSIMEEPYVLADVQARAHELKGMCGNFGLMALSKQAANIEKQAKGGIATDLDKQIARLPLVYTAGRQAIDEWLKT